MSNEEHSTSSPSIWSALELWSKSFSPWQKLLLATAVRSGTVPQAVIVQAYNLLLADHGLGEVPKPEIEIPTSITGKEVDNTPSPKLLGIHSPSGINRLPLTAKLTFADGLTIVYGGNGVGKSGFARVLSNACFSRQQHPIYPDVFDAAAPNVPSATIEVVDRQGNVTPLPFDGISEHPVLKRGFAVFDSAVAERHLTESGPLGFTPTGFDVFGEMARCYVAMQALLQADIQRRRRPHTFANSFIGETTAASTMAATLDANTDLERLRQLASYGDVEKTRFEELQKLADQLRAKSPEAAIRRLNQAKPLIVSLQDRLRLARTALSDEELEKDDALSRDRSKAAQELVQKGTDQFSHEKLAAVGSGEWRDMLAGVQKYVAQQHVHYPGEDDVCVVCQQPLGADARALFNRYAEFLTGDVRAKFEAAELRISSRQQVLDKLDIEPIAEGSVLHAFLSESHPGFLAEIANAFSNFASARAAALAVFNGGSQPATSVLPDFAEPIAEIVSTLDRDLRLLQQSDVPSALKTLEAERVELRHREVLAKNLKEIVAYVEDQQWALRAEQEARSSLNTRHLTEKEGELFGTIIADRYRARLKDECEVLACSVPVEFRTQGQKGKTVRSLQVRSKSPDDILSEGEQRAVALADFLTEIGLNPDNVGIIFDDPVTSLDHERKEKIAARLVAEAKKRQVIILTHDLVFFSMVCETAAEVGEAIVMHYMQRSPDDRPGLVTLNDGPTTTPQYRSPKFAEETLAKAKLASGSNQERLIREGAGQLRRTVEEMVPEYLLKRVVQRWSDRIMVTALKKVGWDNALADEIIALFEECSAIMEGHSHTEAGVESPPTTAKLEELILRTKNAIKSAKVERA